MKIHLKKKLKSYNKNLKLRKTMNTSITKTIDLSQFSVQQLKERLTRIEHKKKKKGMRIRN